MSQGRVPKGTKHGGEFESSPNAESTVEMSSESIFDELKKMLPHGTSETWMKIAPHLPPSAYMSGGTALTVHLLHRVSRDLDIFLERPEDLKSLWTKFQEIGNARATQRDDSTINCVIDDTRVQVLEAGAQKMVAPFITVGGIRIASVDDIMASKLSAVIGRGELRDYFDIMKIEQDRALMVEAGLSLLIMKFTPEQPDRYVMHAVKSLSYLDDIPDDPALPVSRQVIEKYWRARQPAIMKHIALFAG
ncbi:MAG: nucleotidyl transferase AbiEii/AbiGii toxin family protein [Acidimicrobiales bacterium]